MHALTREEVRALDRCAIERLGIPGVILMENAGRNAADAVAELLGRADGRSVAIVAGAGNNGGDGFVIARHLALRGAAVVTYLVVPPVKITGDARVNLDALRALRHDVRKAADVLDGLAEQLKDFDAVVDAVGGTGIRGALRGRLAAAVEQINAAGRPVVAVDLPTGLDCDTGEASGPAVRAALTVTMLARKKGFDAPGAAAYTGRVRVVDIGIPPEVVADIAGAQGADG
jgi:NAD(P)H-hydrate epimerase